MAAAGGQFFLSLWILKSIDPEEFGTFSFLLVVLQLCFGFSSALLCAPYPILFHERERDRGETTKTFLTANLALSVVVGGVLGVIAVALRLPAASGLLLAGYAFLMMLRWFARSEAYVWGEQWRTVLSDVLYGCTLVGIAFLIRGQALSLESALLSLLCAAILGLGMFGPGYFIRQFRAVSVHSLRRYSEIWNRHSRWALLGVVTTEATANAHAYLVTLLAGPAAFAPIAASSLLFRPVQLAQNALGDYERPQIAKRLHADPQGGSKERLGLLRFALLAAWLISALAAIVITLHWPTLIFPRAYQGKGLVVAVVLWMAICGVRALRTPESTLLQAAGRFKPLARVTAVTSGISVTIVLVCLITLSATFSLVGILAGEILVMIGLMRLIGELRSNTLAHN
jgi:hypothetical protein